MFLMVLTQFYIPRFSDLGRDYTRQENVATMQFLANY